MTLGGAPNTRAQVLYHLAGPHLECLLWVLVVRKRLEGALTVLRVMRVRGVRRSSAENVPLDRVLASIRDGLHRLMCPASEAATSWRETRILKRIAQDYCQYVIVPAMVDDWGKASAKAPEKPVQKLKPLAGTSRSPRRRKPPKRRASTS